MSRAITCPRCGFLFGFADEPARYAGPACPSCGELLDEHAAKRSRNVGDRWVVVDRHGQPVAGPFASADSATRWVVTNRFWDHPRGPLDIVPVGTLKPTPRRTTTVERERVPALVDALDVRLAIWIAQAVLDGGEAANPPCETKPAGAA